MRPSRIIANLVGPMLFVQVILGGSATLLGFDVRYHIAWGSVTFVVLILATVLAARDYSTKSTLFKVGIVAIVDFAVQGTLGLIALGSGDVVVLVHLTNAFVLGVFVTYLISFADSADKTSSAMGAPKIQTSP